LVLGYFGLTFINGKFAAVKEYYETINPHDFE